MTGAVVLYLGHNEARFFETFSKIGRPVEKESWGGCRELPAWHKVASREYEVDWDNDEEKKEGVPRLECYDSDDYDVLGMEYGGDDLD